VETNFCCCPGGQDICADASEQRSRAAGSANAYPAQNAAITPATAICVIIFVFTIILLSTFFRYNPKHRRLLCFCQVYDGILCKTLHSNKKLSYFLGEALHLLQATHVLVLK
jgi:hypothetical protein